MTGGSPLPAFNAMTAAARILPANKTFSPSYDNWQEQAWAMWETVSEFDEKPLVWAQ